MPKLMRRSLTSYSTEGISSSKEGVVRRSSIASKTPSKSVGGANISKREVKGEAKPTEDSIPKNSQRGRGRSRDTKSKVVAGVDKTKHRSN